MQPIIRPMCEADLDAVIAAESELFSVPWTREMFLEELNGHLAWTIASDNALCGYACGRRVLDEFELTNIGVAKASQRKGLGKLLLQHILDSQRESGCRVAFLEVRASNAPAIRLYESFGFEIVGLRRHYYSQPLEDAIVMRLFLNTTSDAATH